MLSPISISLVDDDMEDVFLIKRAFNIVKPGISFSHLGDGYKFLNNIIDGQHQSQIEEFKHNILLLDINMPEVSGFDVLRTLRKLSLIERYAVVMLSTSEAKSDEELALKLGAEKFYTKPSTFEGLQGLAKKVIKNYG